MSFSEDKFDVEQSFALARSGYSQTMLMLRALEGEGDQLDEEEKRLAERQLYLLEQGGQLEAADQIGQMYG